MPEMSRSPCPNWPFQMCSVTTPTCHSHKVPVLVVNGTDDFSLETHSPNLYFLDQLDGGFSPLPPHSMILSWVRERNDSLGFSLSITLERKDPKKRLFIRLQHRRLAMKD